MNLFAGSNKLFFFCVFFFIFFFFGESIQPSTWEPDSSCETPIRSCALDSSARTCVTQWLRTEAAALMADSTDDSATRRLSPSFPIYRPVPRMCWQLLPGNKGGAPHLLQLPCFCGYCCCCTFYEIKRNSWQVAKQSCCGWAKFSTSSTGAIYRTDRCPIARKPPSRS